MRGWVWEKKARRRKRKKKRERMKRGGMGCLSLSISDIEKQKGGKMTHEREWEGRGEEQCPSKQSILCVTCSTTYSLLELWGILLPFEIA